jgi:hypothetical protein
MHGKTTIKNSPYVLLSLYENEFLFPLTEFNVAINFPSVMFLYNVKMAKPPETCNKY